MRLNIFSGFLFYILVLPAISAQGDSTKVDTIQIDCCMDPWFGQDKMVHATGSVGLVLVLRGIGGINTQSALISTFTIGIVKEVYDKKYGSGCFSFKDIIANSIGIVIGFQFIINTG